MELGGQILQGFRPRPPILIFGKNPRQQRPKLHLEGHWHTKGKSLRLNFKSNSVKAGKHTKRPLKSIVICLTSTKPSNTSILEHSTQVGNGFVTSFVFELVDSEDHQTLCNAVRGSSLRSNGFDALLSHTWFRVSSCSSAFLLYFFT